MLILSEMKSRLCFEIAACTQEAHDGWSTGLHKVFNGDRAQPQDHRLKKENVHGISCHEERKADILQRGLHEIGDTPQHLTEHALASAGLIDSSTGPKNQFGNVLCRLPKLATSVGNMMQPKGTCGGDRNLRERVINVCTSLPFFVVGGLMMRKFQTKEGREYASSMIAVGAAATLYHASSGKMRKILRKADYWTISVSSTAMMRAVCPKQPRWIQIASIAAIPFKPFMLSTAYTLAMQAEFARQALMYKNIRTHFCRHTVAATAGIVAFALDDIFAEMGFEHSHAAWHCLAAAGVASTGALVEHKERIRAYNSIKNENKMYESVPDSPVSQLSVHDSVASLNTMVSSDKFAECSSGRRAENQGKWKE